MITIDDNGYRTWEGLNRIKDRISIMIESKSINRIDTKLKKGSCVRDDIMEIIFKNDAKEFKLVVTKMTPNVEEELINYLEDIKQRLINNKNI